MASTLWQDIRYGVSSERLGVHRTERGSAGSCFQIWA